MRLIVKSASISNIAKLSISLSGDEIPNIDGLTSMQKGFHVTLFQMTKKGEKRLPESPRHDFDVTCIGDFPIPPTYIDFEPTVLVADDGEKKSAYLRVSESSQNDLMAYTLKVCSWLEAKGLEMEADFHFEKERHFHVSIANKTGLSGDSVAKVWLYPIITETSLAEKLATMRSMSKPDTQVKNSRLEL